MNKIVIIYADVNINITDGSTIWLSNLINTLNVENKLVYFLTIYKIKNKNFNRNIINDNLFKIIDCDNITDVKNKIELLYKQNTNNIDDIIIRSKLIFDVINENWNMLKYITFYGLDVHLSNIVELNNKFKKLWTQTDKLKELYASNGINENKIKLTPPIAWKYDFNLPERTDDEIRLIYVGTLRDDENILEIIEEFKKIHASRPDVVLKIVYGKIHGDKQFVNKVNQIIKEDIEGITFLHNLTHMDTCYEIAISDFGICWRKNGWGEKGELSTKEKEYKIYGLQILNTLIDDLKIKTYKKSKSNSNNKCILISECLDNFTKICIKPNNPINYNVNIPYIFFGIYNEKDYTNFINHNGIKYILWLKCIDLTFINSNKKYIDKIFNKNVFHICYSNFILSKLLTYTHNIIYQNQCISKNLYFNTINDKDKIYIFTSINDKNSKITYKNDLSTKIIESFKNKNFTILNNKVFKNDKIINLYNKIKLGLKLTYFNEGPSMIDKLFIKGIYLLNNNNCMSCVIPYIENVNLLIYQIQYFLQNSNISNIKLNNCDEIKKLHKCSILDNKKYYIYVLYNIEPYSSNNIKKLVINDIIISPV